MRLRVKDVDLALNQIVIRDGKGWKDRVTMLPQRIKADLEKHLVRVKEIHGRDVASGNGHVYLPDALERKSRVGMAVRFSGRYALDGPPYGPMPSASPAREFGSKSIEQGSAPCGHRKTGHLSHTSAFLCYGAVVSGLRHPHSAGTSRSQGREHHDDLHTRAQQAWNRRQKPARLKTEENAERPTFNVQHRKRIAQVPSLGRNSQTLQPPLSYSLAGNQPPSAVLPPCRSEELKD
jgi:hypothetical protein